MSGVLRQGIHMGRCPKFLWWLCCLACLTGSGPALHAEAWPKCAVVSGGKGAPAIVVDGRTHAPLILALNNQFHRDEVLLGELRQAAQAQFPFFSINMNLGWITPDEEAAAALDTFCAAHPDGYFLLRVWLGAPPAWLKEHPADCVTKADGEVTGYASPSSPAWRKAAGELLRARLQQVINGPHGGRFLGVCLTYLQTGEWFYFDTNDFMDYSPVNAEAYRAWLKRESGWPQRLRKPWAGERKAPATAALPGPELREAAVWGPFRDTEKQASAMAIQRFQSDLIAETIGYFARIVKEATRGRSLAGAFYGYTFELNNNGPRALAQSGHLGLGTLLQNPDIDFISAPYSYFERGLGQPGHFHLPIDSVALHGKLAIMEEDSYTHLSQPQPDSGLIAPGWPDRTTNTDETLDLARRNYGNFLTHRCGMWYFDLLSDGRWSDPAFWDSTVLLRRMAAELRGAGPFRPEVAFLADEDSVHTMRATTWPVLIHALSWWRSELDRIGAPVGYYLQRDLGRLPDSVKVIILGNAYRLSKKELRHIRRFASKGGTVIWCYAPGVSDAGGPNPMRIREVTGFQVEARFDEVPMQIKEEFSGELREIDSASWQPRFVLTGQESDVIARYAQTDEIAGAAHPLGKGVAIYTAAPRLSAATLREICRRAGVFLYRDTPGMTGVVGQYLVVHSGDGPTEQETHLFWPKSSIGAIRVAPGEVRQFMPGKDGQITDFLPPKSTAIYRFEAP